MSESPIAAVLIGLGNEFLTGMFLVAIGESKPIHSGIIFEFGIRRIL
jgi:hypothetical protein